MDISWTKLNQRILFLEIRAHNDLSLWPNVQDPATQHPMSGRVLNMMHAYKRLYDQTGKPQPKMKLASFLSAKEVMAAAEFGCHSATISPKLLDQLAELEYDATKQPGEGVPKPTPGVEHYQSTRPTPVRLQKLATVDPVVAMEWDSKGTSNEVDYLANGGAELHKAIETDPIMKTRLADALDTFTEAENKSRAKIEAVLATL